MRMTYVLVKDHLEQAQAILDNRDRESQQLQEVLQMVIGLIDELQTLAQRKSMNIINFPVVRRQPPNGAR